MIRLDNIIEMDLYIEVLGLVVTSVIALVSLVYAIKQRNLAKSGIAKRTYLENALGNLNGAIQSLREIKTPNISELSVTHEAWGDTHVTAMSILADILMASFELRKTIILLEVSYVLRDLGERDKSGLCPPDRKMIKEITDFRDIEPKSFANLLTTHSVLLDSDASIDGFERHWTGNNLSFSIFVWGLNDLTKTINALLRFEEVYETVCPECINKIEGLYAELSLDIYETISKPKRVVVDLDEFAETKEILEYLVNEILNYSHIAQKLSAVANIITELTEARKALFLKVS